MLARGTPKSADRDAVARPRLSRLPIILTVGCVVVFGLAFFSISWPYVDAYNNLHEASRWTWRQYVSYAVRGGTEYRPLLTLALKLSYELVGLRLWWYQALVLMQFSAVLALLVWIFRPVGSVRGLAACLALACVVGLHTSRALFLFVPLNAHSVALGLVLLAVALAIEPRTRAVDWVFFPLTLVALFVLESGLLIAPLVLVLWWARAPGVGLRGATAMAAAVACYVAVRFAVGAVEGTSLYTGTGLWFAGLDPETLSEIFKHAPWLFWLYNVLSGFLTVAASEPRAGIFEFLASVLRGDTALWRWWHVGSSLLTTAVIVFALTVYRPASTRDRLLVLAGLTLVVFGSALGFLYARDRIALSAGVGYGVLLYVSVATLLERQSTPRRFLVGIVGVVAAAWLVRGAETYFQLRDTAWAHRLEWTDYDRARRGTGPPETELFVALRAEALRVVPADPRGDPGWTYALFERTYAGDRTTPGATVDATLDNTVRALSPPFDIRWTPEVDEATRLRLEAELGLTEAQPVQRDKRGRTWTYRLQRPSKEGIQRILLHASVEDTARLNSTRLEIED